MIAQHCEYTLKLTELYPEKWFKCGILYYVDFFYLSYHFLKTVTFKTSYSKNKDITRKENYSPNSLINLDVKVLKEILANPANM